MRSVFPASPLCRARWSALDLTAADRRAQKRTPWSRRRAVAAHVEPRPKPLSVHMHGWALASSARPCLRRRAGLSPMLRSPAHRTKPAARSNWRLAASTPRPSRRRRSARGVWSSVVAVPRSVSRSPRREPRPACVAAVHGGLSGGGLVLAAAEAASAITQTVRRWARVSVIASGEFGASRSREPIATAA